MHLMDDQWPTLTSGQSAVITVAQRSFRLNPSFVADLASHDVAGRAALLGRPYLVVHAVDDTVVSHDNAVALHPAAGPPKKLASLPSGGHLFTGRDDAETLLRTVVGWFDETL